MEKRTGKIDSTVKYILQREDFNSLLPFVGVMCDKPSMSSFLIELQSSVKDMNAVDLLNIDCRGQSKDNFTFSLGQRSSIEGMIKLINAANTGHEPELLHNLTGSHKSPPRSSSSSASNFLSSTILSSNSSDASHSDQQPSSTTLELRNCLKITPDNFFQKILEFINENLEESVTVINISNRSAHKYPLSAVVWCFKCKTFSQKVAVYVEKRNSGNYTRFKHIQRLVDHIKQCNVEFLDESFE